MKPASQEKIEHLKEEVQRLKTFQQVEKELIEENKTLKNTIAKMEMKSK